MLGAVDMYTKEEHDKERNGSKCEILTRANSGLCKKSLEMKSLRNRKKEQVNRGWRGMK